MNATSRRSLFAATTAVIMGSGITAGVAASVADLVPVDPDAELIELGRRPAVEWGIFKTWEATTSGMSDDDCDAAMKPSSDIVDQIEHMEAHTFEGIKAKALAISWCTNGQDIALDQFSPYEGATTDARIAASIVRDLLRVS